MHLRRIVLFGLAVIVPVAIGLAIWKPLPSAPVSDERGVMPSFSRSSAALAPLPESIGSAPSPLIELGRRLFHDGRLSRNGSIACASCHPVLQGGTDKRPTSVGIEGRTGQANAPTVLNAAFNFRQFWDGRAATLEEQVSGPIHNPVEMDNNWNAVLAAIARDPDYVRLARALDATLDAELIARAIAAYERTLITPGAPFDRYLSGDSGALSAEAKRGYELFQGLGCIACHQGVNIGGNLFAHLGVMGDFFTGRPEKKIDLGRYNVTGRAEDKHKFKVPSLRNVALTAPYFHDGSVATLEEAVDLMARFQLGVELAADDRTALVAFLHSLTGRLPTP